MKTYTLHFIRHGMTTANEEGRYVGHQDLSLSLQGEDELRYLKDNCVYPDPPVVFTSPLKRCTETCEILFPDAQPVVMRELIEYNFGEFEGHTAEELQHVWLSGAFTAHSDLEAAITIGIFPDLPRERYTCIANTSLAGAKRMLLDASLPAEARHLAENMYCVQFASIPDFIVRMRGAKFIPHTDMERFPRIAAKLPE